MTVRPSVVAGGSDRSTNILLAGFGALLLLAVLVHAAVWLATLMVSGHPPHGTSVAAALRVLAHPEQPAAAYPPGSDVPGPWAVWPAAVVLTAVAALAAHAARRGWQLLSSPAAPARLPGTATAADVTRLMGRRALLRRTQLVRPSLARARPTDVGLFLGRAHGRELWASLEDSYLVVAPPRAGKGVHLVIPAILDAPGAVLAPSTKADNLLTTLRSRSRVGPVAVFDPQQLAGRRHGLRWSPVRGCADPLVAILRARALVDAAGVGRNVTDGDFWSGSAQAVIRALLHAAALDGRDARTVLGWVLAPANQEPVRILRAAAGAAPGWADELEAQAGTAPQQRDGVWGGVRRAFDSLADPRVLDAVTPTGGEEFDPARFIRDRGTLYLLGTSGAQLSVAPLITALIEDITDVARRMAAASPQGRLDPPMLLALDEAANIAPLPSLPSLLADGGGVGLPTICVLQSMAQARARWEEHAAYAMWDAATIKVVLGGLANARDLEDLSRLAGLHDEQTVTWTTDGTGARTSSVAMRNVPILPVDAIRNLPFGTGVVLHRTARPVLTTLTPWWRRRDGGQLKAEPEEAHGGEVPVGSRPSPADELHNVASTMGTGPCQGGDRESQK